tara:strand:- start:8228 stop:8551 length:324 start_codon:yes stop_codon:yes gene_type:complete
MNIEDMKEIKLDISEKDDKIYCKVRIPARSSIFPKRLNIETPLVVQMLKRRGYQIGTLVEGAHVYNKSAVCPLRGTWVFEKKAPSSPKKKTTRKRRPPPPPPPTTEE